MGRRGITVILQSYTTSLDLYMMAISFFWLSVNSMISEMFVSGMHIFMASVPQSPIYVGGWF